MSPRGRLIVRPFGTPVSAVVALLVGGSGVIAEEFVGIDLAGLPDFKPVGPVGLLGGGAADVDRVVCGDFACRLERVARKDETGEPSFRVERLPGDQAVVVHYYGCSLGTWALSTMTCPSRIVDSRGALLVGLATCRHLPSTTANQPPSTETGACLDPLLRVLDGVGVRAGRLGLGTCRHSPSTTANQPPSTETGPCPSCFLLVVTRTPSVVSQRS